MTSTIVGWSILLASPALLADGPPARGETVRLSGKVVTLDEALGHAGIHCDAEPIARQVVLQDKDHALIPLLSDDSSRALFVDARLRNRPAELTARRFPGIPYVQVVSFRILEEGTLQTPEYYCEICTISVRYPQTCPCCQGPMVLRMKPQSR